MKKIFIAVFITIIISGLTYAATYKINSSGQLKNESGKVVGTLPVQVYSGPTVKYIDIVVDYSGSMSEAISTLKNTVNSIISALPSETYVGLRKVGGEFSCAATTQLAPLRVNNASAVMSAMNSTVNGDEPVVLGITKAISEDFVSLDKTTPKKIILITDGEYTCNENPCEFVRKLMAERNDIHIDVIFVRSKFLFFSSFDDKTLACLANTTNGKIYRANNINQISSVVQKSMHTVSDEVAQKIENNTNQNSHQQYEHIKY